MGIKRVLSGVFGLPIIALLLVFGNKYILDVVFAVIAIISVHEYMKCMEEKVKPVKWIGYVLAVSISVIHLVPLDMISRYLGLAIAGVMAILFTIVIVREMKTNVLDIAVSLFGYLYIVGFIVFLALLYGLEGVGKYFIWYIFIATWGCDIVAYCIGSKFGKHKFSKISPNKSIEGCIAGTIGGVVLVILYTVLLNNVFSMNINYIVIGIIGLVLTILGQIGDFSASAIKRYAGIKDFSNLIPGHGGMIDRIDSVIFAAPFAYYFITMFII